ncbi:hypothetical protein Acr_22g0005750 [Actinidia rufa]|uniref:Uncharacterized protein n=1 Tax=Actinidia rufa TaxID=165716 RepID=A0A7J0GK36_9ERIC|nr:hypothetical protein Acr_22g0005750 [Actinidia rufa]
MEGSPPPQLEDGPGALPLSQLIDVLVTLVKGPVSLNTIPVLERFKLSPLKAVRDGTLPSRRRHNSLESNDPPGPVSRAPSIGRPVNMAMPCVNTLSSGFWLWLFGVDTSVDTSSFRNSSLAIVIREERGGIVRGGVDFGEESCMGVICDGVGDAGDASDSVSEESSLSLFYQIELLSILCTCVVACCLHKVPAVKLHPQPSYRIREAQIDLTNLIDRTTRILPKIVKTLAMHVPREVLFVDLPAFTLGIEGEVGIWSSLDHNPLAAECRSQPDKELIGEEDHLTRITILPDTAVMHQLNRSSRVWMSRLTPSTPVSRHQ